MAVKMCVLNEEKICDECGACRMCDLDPTKICDNCMRCVNGGQSATSDYAEIAIDKVYVTEDDESYNADSDYGTGEGLSIAGAEELEKAEKEWRGK